MSISKTNESTEEKTAAPSLLSAIMFPIKFIVGCVVVSLPVGYATHLTVKLFEFGWGLVG